MSRIWRLALLVLILLLAGSAPALAANVLVTIQNFKFVPAVVSVNLGDTVVWTNRDAVPHGIHWTSGGLSDDPKGTFLQQNQSYALVFTAPGLYSYVCSVHGAAMPGSVVVQGTPTPAPTTPRPTPSPTPVVTPSPSASPSPSESPSPTPTPGTSPSPSPSASLALAPSPYATALAAPASQTNTIVGVALVAVGVAILAGALWWRFGRT